MSQEIISQLKAERAERENRVREDQTRIVQLTAAIDALEGKPSAPARTKLAGPPVTDMVFAAARELGPNTVFDHQKLRAKAVELFAAHEEKIKSGIYPAVAQLLKTKFERTPGGFKLRPQS